MDIMRDIPDKYFELAIVDPPYGINHSEIAGKQSGTQYGNAKAPKNQYDIKLWDKTIPEIKYFNEIFRISENQIIWGANNFSLFLPFSTGWIFWDKDNGTNNFSDGELAFTSFKKGMRKIKITWNGMIQENMKNKDIRIHPTQKPVALYRWLLHNYAKPGDKIIDTHSGSGSCAIACHIEKHDFLAIEKDPDYHAASVARLKDCRLEDLVEKLHGFDL